MKYGIVLISVDTPETAKRLTDLLLGERLVACVQMVPIESHYIWKGKQEQSKEILLVAKTKKQLYKKLESLVKQNHPYEVPEILFFPVDAMLPAYRLWLKNVLKEDN